MKKSVLATLCILVGIMLVASMAYAAGGIKTTAHDLSTKGKGNWAGDSSEQSITGLDRICIYCHAPHNTKQGTDLQGVKYYPLWNHTVTKATYLMYGNGAEVPNDQSHQSQAAAELIGKNQPGSVSRLCLSCHDGTIATNAYGATDSASKGAGDVLITAALNPKQFLIGGDNGAGVNDLSNHHPIGFNYANVAAKDDEIAKTTASMGTGGLKIADLLWQGNMECTTCHDVHNTKNTGEKFLWISDAQSNLCLTCHLKG